MHILHARYVPSTWIQVAHLHELKVGKLLQEVPIMDIKSHLLKNFSTQTNEEQKRKTLQKSVKAVEVNANGTTGYMIKEGPNKGKVLGHLSTKSNNNF